MSDVRLPTGFRVEPLKREHPRARFSSGVREVDDWLVTKALQQQSKRLSGTKVLLSKEGAIAGYYILASGQVDFDELPKDLTGRLPRRALPVAVLAWLGLDRHFQGQQLGGLLLAHALSDCWLAARTFLFVAVILDCLGEDAKRFYRRWDFAEVPGHPYRLFLSARQLDAMMQAH